MLIIKEPIYIVTMKENVLHFSVFDNIVCNALQTGIDVNR